MSHHVQAGVTAAAMVLLAACGGGGGTPADTGPSARELAATLVVAEDLGTGWSVLTPPEDYGSVGVVTDKNKMMVPRTEFCDKASAASQQAAKALEWEAFTQHHYATGSDRHLVFVQEFLLSDRASVVRRTFDLLAAGGRSCEGDRSVTPDGETVTQGALELPAIGQDRSGFRDTIAEPGDNPTTWDLRSVLVRDGTVLIGITVAEIVPPGVPKILSDAKATDLIVTIADKAH
jgi:hypothetical protein